MLTLLRLTLAQAAAEFLGETLEGKLVAVQGCGQVGLPLCRYLVAAGARFIASESSAQRAAEVGDELQRLGVQLRTAAVGDNSILYANAVVVRRVFVAVPIIMRVEC